MLISLSQSDNIVRHPYDEYRRRNVTLMNEHDWLAGHFEEHRGHLRGVAYRMLGSLSEAEDAVQEAWLRLSRSDTSAVENLGGWLTTVTARVCLDMLRSRQSRREEPFDVLVPSPAARDTGGVDPEHEVLMADAVGLAMLVVLETLSPAERLAFVLHDMFAMPFDEIAPIVGRTATATRQLASRARRRVQGADITPEPDIAQQRVVVDAYLAAARNADFDALLAVLDPDVVLRMDGAVMPSGVSGEMRSATAVASRAVKGRARAARAVLVNGAVGVVVAPRGRLMMVLDLTIVDGKITEIDAIADPERLRNVSIAILDDPSA
jgi:RNA polymerase sigma-70 factor (ECF subfamily)